MVATASNAQLIRFGNFELDLRAAELRKNGVKLKFGGQPFQVLAILLENPGQLVTREELQKRLWPDTFVDVDHNLNSAINRIRETLGDSAENPRFLVTVPRRGYRFVAPISAPAADEGQRSPAPHKSRALTFALATLVLLAIGFVALHFARKNSPAKGGWVQITNFPDSATSPALSPDGRMVTFIRGPETFVSPGQIYVKLLPNGEPTPLTHDKAPKMAPVFSPDSSRVAYTTTNASFGWNTWVVPVLGGEPSEMMPNAAALTWLDSHQILFSEITRGHMAIVTATESRAGERTVYEPTANEGMAHRSWLSPDGKQVLLSEMDTMGWRPCRVVPFDESSTGQNVGPVPSRCTYAGWSPDGRWMYFSADAGNGFHIWRAPFPDGQPEQITFGPTEEEGIAMAADGHSLMTSVGIRHSSVWLHDARGDRQVSAEGSATLPGLGYGYSGRSPISRDGKKLYYLVQKEAGASFSAGELCALEIESGRAQLILPGVLMKTFELAPDGEHIVFTSPTPEGPRIWVASLDRHAPPKQITTGEALDPSFGPSGDILFRVSEGGTIYVYRTDINGSEPQKVGLDPARNGFRTSPGISPHGEWELFGLAPMMGRRASGGPTFRICDFCNANWGPKGDFFYVRFRDVGENGGGKTFAFRLPPGKELPPLPPEGFKSADDVKGPNVVAVIDMAGISVFAPGPDPSIYAYARVAVQRNLFRIPLE
jgi:eukaryotic-like serine/threonine-protein kinase